MTSPGQWDLRRAGLMIGAVLALGYGIQQFPSTSPAATSAAVAPAGNASPAELLAAPAQSALDQILGPGHAVVTASASYSQPSSRLSTRYDPKHTAVLSQSAAGARSAAGGTGYGASTTQNGVGESITRSSTAGGQITRLTVAVVLDSRLRPTPKLAVIRQQVSAALGLQPSRGDRLSVVALPLAGSSTGARSSPATTVTRITPYLKTGFSAVAAAVLLVLVMILRKDPPNLRNARV